MNRRGLGPLHPTEVPPAPALRGPPGRHRSRPAAARPARRTRWVSYEFHCAL